ncbi:cytochrome-c peroxidase [Puniceicoccaceae bacterium]|nr:cytochrome-c peroxidase [Puniceicoccaceae bacterium]MDC0497368.1 cytochrome-c peroxidase [bacterium]
MCFLLSTENGFSDSAEFSNGFKGDLATRNSKGFSNMRFYQSGYFFWDELAKTLEEQVLKPIQNVYEMGLAFEGADEGVASL